MRLIFIEDDPALDVAEVNAGVLRLHKEIIDFCEMPHPEVDVYESSAR